MIRVSNTIKVKFIEGEYRRWLESKVVGEDPPMPGPSWNLLHHDLTMEESQLLLTRLKEEHLV